ncbi:MAG TPA: hypothetical protein VF979_09370, partial [Streptosporangiaceae bacterium]
RLTSDRAGRDRYDDEEPAWSATNRITFVRTRIGSSRGQIYTMNADGSTVTALTQRGRAFGQPTWSPSGRLIAFTATHGQHGMVIEVAAADGSGMRPVSLPRWTSYNPVWTPNGKVAFLVDRGTGTSIYTVNPDGTGLSKLPATWANIQQLIKLAWGSASLPPAAC